GQSPDIVNPDVINDPVNPLHDRVGRQLDMVRAVLDATELLGVPTVTYDGVPTYADLVRDGLSPWLNAPTALPSGPAPYGPTAPRRCRKASRPTGQRPDGPTALP